MICRLIVAFASLMAFASTMAEPIIRDTHMLYANKRGFNSLDIAYVVTSLRGKELEAGLAERLVALCSDNDHLDKYIVHVYSDSESADFERNNIGNIPNMGDEQWQRADDALLASYSPFDGNLTFRGEKGGSGLNDQRLLHIGKTWCHSP